MPEFHKTQMGRAFYDGTMPQINRHLKIIGEEMKVQNELKHKELQLKEKELQIRERELILLERKKNYTTLYQLYK